MSKTLRPADPAPLTTTTQPAPSSPPASATTYLIRKVLVANRGEIARRVIRTCREMGIATVAVFSDADVNAAHLYEADEAIHIGPAAATASYLNIPMLIEAATRTHADAVHPGYGFLAENAAFAAACRDSGLIFIGPAPDVIARMGSKREARRLMAAAGVPVVPGYDGADQSDARFVEAARAIGYPVLVKASAGGGGKGMRSVRAADELAEALAGARREALAAFGDDTLLLEKLIDEPRHVEFQIFGDIHGHLIHLGERECTIQRRHQKIVEETPSPALTPELRARMGAAAVAVGRQLGYTNAGTVEFILAPSGDFYFLEVNTRLQVEHPVTELVTGLDLVRWQILVAEGRPLPLAQDAIRTSGHAVEVRLYAEDPATGFLPQTGPIALWRPVTDAAGVRVDASIQTGDAVTPYYDPLLAKISAHGADRDEALRRLDYALARTVLLGLRTNQDYLRRVLLHPAHLSGQISTAFVARHAADLLVPADQPLAGLSGDALAALAVTIHRLPERPSAGQSGHWRNNPGPSPLQRYTALRDDTGLTIGIRLAPATGNHLAVSIVSENQERTLDVLVHARSGGDLAVEIDGRLLHAVCAEAAPGEWWVRAAGATHALRWVSPLPEPSPSLFATTATPEAHAASTARRDAGADGAILAPMPGQVVAVAASEGQAVRAGDPLVILEAMKMEHTVRAPRDGVVVALRCRPGDQVAPRAVLLEIRPLDHPSS